jgi:acyl-CoA dehydrogenase
MNLEDLRAAVRAWLDGNVPRDLKLPGRGEELSPELVTWTLEFRRKLGALGWLGPSWPTYLGGGGLPGVAGVAVMEALRARRLPPLVVQQTVLTTLRVWGTEEQKARWLIPTLRGEITVCQIVSEPGGGADLATKTTTAIRDGDEFGQW